MGLRLISNRDFQAGCLFVLLGLAFAWKATDYPMGTAARMGPGFFPFWLALLLALLGAVVCLSALSRSTADDPAARWDWRVLLLVLGSIIMASLLLRPLGLLPSLFLLILLSSLASHDFHWKVAFGNALFLVAFCYFAFIKGLGLTFPLWPAAFLR